MENQPQPHKQQVKSTGGQSPQPPQDSEDEQSPSVTQATAAAPYTTVRSPLNAAKTEKIMREFLATIKPEEKLGDVFTKMAEALRLQEEASLLTSLNILPRLSTQTKTNTAQEIALATHAQATVPLPAATREKNAPLTSTTVTHAEEVEYTVDEVMEEVERAVEGSEVGTSTEKDVVTKGVVGDETYITEEDVLITGKNSDDIVGTDLNADVEEGVGDKPDFASNIEGETPGKCVEGKPMLSLLRGNPYY